MGDRDLSDPKERPNEKDESVHIRVDRGTKQYWEHYVADETNEVSSVSELVRLSVAKETSGKYDSNEQELDEIIEELTTIQENTRQLNQTLSTLRRENIEEDEMEDLLETTIDHISDRYEGVFDDDAE